MTRKATNRLIDLAEAGIVSWRELAIMALKWMSEDDVADMMKTYELDEEE